MRRPTSYMRAHAWWLGALANKDAERHDGLPQCGLYKRRMIKDGPWVPVRIFLDRDIDPATGELTRDEVMCIEIEGIIKSSPDAHWSYLVPISQAEYDHLMDFRLRDVRMLDPRTPINLAEMPTPPC